MASRSAVADLNHAVPCSYARGIGACLALVPARVVLDRNPAARTCRCSSPRPG
jgi:hypothetical protein